MQEKKNLGRMLACFAVCFVLFGGFVMMADPFYHYHEPWFDMPVILDNAVYQTAGAAKNLEYTSAIVGTSMTENMHTSWFDEELGWNTMKLSYSGARSNDLQAIFAQISQKEGDLEHVVMDINAYQLTSASWTSYVERPEYLYDGYFYNDYEYLYNHDTFVLSARRILDGLQGIGDNIDTAYTWEDDALFGREKALNACRDVRNQLLATQEGDTEADSGHSEEGQSDYEYGLTVCQENLDNILPFIEAHPETEFHIVFPPYSMLYWEQEILKNTLDETMAIYAYAIKELLGCDNVKVYYFQNETEIITNLDNYRDNAHHKPEYNKYIFECIKNGKNLLTVDDYEEKLADMYRFAREFPYETLWEE